MEKAISNIVFTKNRPLQLDAYLASLYRHFPPELIQTYIIYKAELFEHEYEQLFQDYSDCVVITEREFSGDFLELLAQTDTKYVLFGVDDVVYFDGVDYEVIDKVFDEHAENIFGFSLRFNKQSVEAGNDAVDETAVLKQPVYSINWTRGRTPSTRYPFELCATIYRTSLVKKIIRSSRNNSALLESLLAPGSPIIRTLGRVISTRSILKRFGYFFNPNTLESWNCRWCQNNSRKLPAYLFFQKQCAGAIQVNIVNTSTIDSLDIADGCTIESLAERYKQGFRMDIDFVSRNKPRGTHCSAEYFKLNKTGTCTTVES